jgi:branched-chain amino acid transport system permease protein
MGAMTWRGFKLAALITALVALPLLPPFNERPDLVRWLVEALILAQFALALDFSAGLINVVNFGFAAFAGFGGYVSAWSAVNLSLSPWLTMWLAFAGAGLLGACAGGLTLRLRGIYAAVGLWFFGLAVKGLAINMTEITGGSSGFIAPTLFDGASSTPYYYTGATLLLASYVLLRCVARSSVGLAFRAIGQNLDVARASGVSLVRFRLLNVILSCAFAGLFGAFYVHYYGVLTPNMLDTTRTIQVLVPVYLGGRGTLWGGAAAAIPLVFLANWLEAQFSELPGLDLVIYSALLMTVVTLAPGGIASLIDKGRLRLLRASPKL